MTINLFIPLTKIDASRREVWGVAAIEQPDRSREIMDYELSKPNFIKWSDSIRKASNGKSLGNVRDSHSTHAVGKVIALEPDDTAKAFRVGVKVVDDNAWQKVQEGVFTGFSIGGSYGKRAPDSFYKDHIRYEAIPTELSLVDVPCIPDAQFEFIKSNGESEMKKFTKAITEEEQKKLDELKVKEGETANLDAETPAEDKGENPVDEGTEKDTAEGEMQNAESKQGETKPDETETANSETETESEAGASPEGQGLSTDKVKEIVIGLLMELGLVQQQGGSMMLSAKIDDMSKSIEGMSKIGDLQKSFDTLKSELENRQLQIVNDLAKTVIAVEALEKRGATGPVLREVAPLTAQAQADTQRADLLLKMAKDSTDPNVQQSLRNEAAKLQIKQIQNT